MDYWFLALLIALLVIVGYVMASLYVNNVVEIKRQVYRADRVASRKATADDEAARADPLKGFFPEKVVLETPPNDTPPSMCPAPRPEKTDLPVVNGCPLFVVSSAAMRLR